MRWEESRPRSAPYFVIKFSCERQPCRETSSLLLTQYVSLWISLPKQSPILPLPTAEEPIHSMFSRGGRSDGAVTDQHGRTAKSTFEGIRNLSEPSRPSVWLETGVNLVAHDK
ncbi:hypothetical protein H101_04151 [Trichophyton interdigitale H6]|nr:hypothetical protein H101_04151 [Trichophyton interdigitale H6]